MSKLIIYKCETPLHVGSGNDLTLIDMPIQREQHTQFPKIESSGIKGGFRKNFNKNYKKFTEKIFGAEEGNSYAGSLQFLDAKILFFPVKTLKGIFIWITCPFVISRFNSELDIMNLSNFKINFNDIKIDENQAIINKNNNSQLEVNKEKCTFIEEFGYKVLEKEINFDNLIDKMNLKDDERNRLKGNIVVLNNESFSYFVEMSTEVNTRIRIGNDGIVIDGGVFTEEYIPTESIMYNFIRASAIKNSKEELKKFVYESFNKSNDINGLNDQIENSFVSYLMHNNIFQFGGNSTLGKGIVSVHVIGYDNYKIKNEISKQSNELSVSKDNTNINKQENEYKVSCNIENFRISNCKGNNTDININININSIVNYNLILNKYIYFKDNKNINKLKDFCSDTDEGERRCILEYINNKKEKIIKFFTLNEYNKYSFNVKSSSRTVIGHGEVSVREVSIKLDHIYGVPFIPASSIKGAFRSYLNEKYSTIDGHFYKEDEIISKIFGSEDKRGELIFLDIYPQNFKIGMDIMNVHYKDYYSKMKAPKDSSKPNIVEFPVVEKGAKFEIILLSKEKEYKLDSKELKINIKDEFAEFLEEKALGAKTSVGYGYFEKDTKEGENEL